MLVHSYARFSDPSQEGGDSLRRQREAAEEFCKRKGYTLSDLKFTDKGRSGFKGDKQRALKAFEKAIADGRVKPGEMLLCENVDRLSRKGIEETRELIGRILKAGIDIQILQPMEQRYRAKDLNDIGSVMTLVAFAYQANLYSENLSGRIKAYNANLRSQVRAGILASYRRWYRLGWRSTPRASSRNRPEAVKAIKYISSERLTGLVERDFAANSTKSLSPSRGARTRTAGTKRWSARSSRIEPFWGI